MSGKWNQERVDYLVQCFKDGFSGGQTAGLMTTRFHEKFTRCSVVAKWNRMGLMRGQETKRQRRSVARRVRVAKAPPKEPTARQSALAEVLARAPRDTIPAEEPPPANLVKFEDLTSRSCRWIFGDPREPDHGFCGKQTVLGQSWCPDHCRRVYAPPVVRQREPKPVVVPTFNDLEKV
jgi:hypothetical protein